VTPLQPEMRVVTQPPLIASFREAVGAASDALFLQASRQFGSDPAAVRRSWMIDPLIDGVSGMQSNATRTIEVRAIEVARSNYPQFALRSFRQLLWMNHHCYCSAPSPPGATTGHRDSFSICLALANLKTRTIAAKVTTRTYMDGVDHRPTPYFRDSPVWMKQGSTDRYIASCQKSKVRDPIQTSYVVGMSAPLLSPRRLLPMIMAAIETLSIYSAMHSTVTAEITSLSTTDYTLRI
jgi:hypothetical protein